MITSITLDPVCDDPKEALLGTVSGGLSSNQTSPVDVSFTPSGTTGITALIPNGFPIGMAQFTIAGMPNRFVSSTNPLAPILPSDLNTGEEIPSDIIEVLLHSTTVKYDIIETGNAAPSDDSRSMNYTMEENVGGTVFLVTRTKFPDGTTAVISSVPKP